MEETCASHPLRSLSAENEYLIIIQLAGELVRGDLVQQRILLQYGQ